MVSVRTGLLIAVLLMLSLGQVCLAAGMQKPNELDDASWASLQKAFKRSVVREARLSGSGSPPNADGAANDDFGRAIALSGDTAAIGAPHDDVGSQTDQGSVYIYRNLGSADWVLQAKLVAADGVAADRFGESIALEGNLLLIGASMADVGDQVNQGSAYLFALGANGWALQTKLLANDGASNDAFGRSVVITGDTLIIGAPGDDGAIHTDQGSAYVYQRAGSNWSQQAKLVAADGAGGDRFGHALAASGDTVFIGAQADDVAGQSDQGSVYVFHRSGSQWTQQAQLSAGDGAANDLFGYAMAISTDTAIIGAPWQRINGRAQQGGAYIYVRSGESWAYQAKLVAQDGKQSDNFGSAVALQGNTALVGAPGADQTFASSSEGAAYVYTRTGTNWNMQAKLLASNASPEDAFGSAVALFDETALISAVLDNVGDNVNQGSSYIHTRSGSSWTQRTQITSSNGEKNQFFGISIAISGDTALIGEASGDVGAVRDQGKAFVFVRAKSGWALQAILVANDGTVNDFFGASVALRGDLALVGSYADVGVNQAQGAVYSFVRSGSTWQQQSKLVAKDGSSADQFGVSLAWSGSTVLVGAIQHGSSAGVRPGAVYVYSFDGSQWNQQAKLLASDGQTEDLFGFPIVFDGNTALIGASWTDLASNLDQGSAYVFTRTGTSWTQQARLVASDGALRDNFGYALSLDGDTAVIGSPNNDVGANIDQGSAYVFTRSGSVWTQQTQLFAGDGAASDNFGSAVLINGDTLLIGAYRDDVDAIDQGSVYEFARAQAGWSQRTKWVLDDARAGELFGFPIIVQGDTVFVGAIGSAGPAPFGNPQEGSVYAFSCFNCLFQSGFETP